ncbi:MAG: WYL domain-containing protein [Actinomycetes bacterium]
MAETKDRLERVGRLLACLLDSDGPVPRDRLESIFPEYLGESGRRRFEDDKSALRRSGIRLRVVEHDGVIVGYQLRQADYELPELNLTKDEQLALNLAVGSVDFSTVPWAQQANRKLGINALAPMVALAELPGLDLLPRLLRAVTERQPIAFEYHDAERQVDPWGLVLKHGRWYLPGFDHLRDAQRVFRIDRIKPETLKDRAGEPFEIPAGIVPRDLVPDDALAIQVADKQTARLRADRRLAGLLSPDGAIVDTQDGSGEVFVDVEVSFPDAFISWVLGFGELVIVEGPPDLRHAVIERLTKYAV